MEKARAAYESQGVEYFAHMGDVRMALRNLTGKTVQVIRFLREGSNAISVVLNGEKCERLPPLGHVSTKGKLALL